MRHSHECERKVRLQCAYIKNAHLYYCGKQLDNSPFMILVLHQNNISISRRVVTILIHQVAIYNNYLLHPAYHLLDILLQPISNLLK